MEKEKVIPITKNDTINNPSHYTSGKEEVIEMIHEILGEHGHA